MAQRLKSNDSFRQWFDKINSNFNDLEELIAFEVLSDSGLDVTIGAGRVRSKEQIIEIAQQVVTLNPSVYNLVGLNTVDETAPFIEVHEESAAPASDFIKLHRIQASASSVAGYEDLRTALSVTAGKNVETASGILMFNKNIKENTTVPADRNALSIDAIVDNGVEVTVTDGSTWVVL